MLRSVSVPATFFLLFWAFFLLFQNKTIYDNSLGRVARTWVNIDGERKLIDEPFQGLTNENYIRWDGVHYQLIKEHGYSVSEAGGDYIFAFFPFFPVLWRMSALPPIGVVFLNYLMFAIGLMLLYLVFNPSTTKRGVLLWLVICLPTAVVFLIPYTEATFLLLGAMGLVGLLKKRYWLYFIGFFLCALTRPSYTFLILSILGTEFYFLMRHRQVLHTLKRTGLMLLPLILGTLTVSFIQVSFDGGGMTKFVEVQKYWNHVLSVPHGIRDWSHEGFGMSLAAIFLISIPLLVILLQFLFGGLTQSSDEEIEDVPETYVQVLSVFYLVGVSFFVLLFQGGSMNGLSRYVLCTPFFFSLIFSAFPRVSTIRRSHRFFMFAVLSIMSIMFLGLIEYSTYWNFSDMGLFLLIAVMFLWLFQDMSRTFFYRLGLFLTIVANAVWTSYLFNTYIADGWIFT